MAGSVQGTEREAAEHEVGVRLQGVDVSAGKGRQLAGAGDEVVMDVRVERMGDAKAELLGVGQVGVYVAEGVDDRSHLRVRVRDQEAGVAQLLRLEGLNGEHRAKYAPGAVRVPGKSGPH